jgi:hypothetical protein
LQVLDCHELARQDERLSPLTRPGCMGEVYAKTKSVPVWKNSLPLFELR